MFENIFRQYNLEEISCIRYSKNAYKIKTDKGDFVIKESSADLENIYQRLYILQVNYFEVPLKDKNGVIVHEHEGKQYVITNYLSLDHISGIDLKIQFYLKAIGELHKKSNIYLQVNDAYFEKTLNYLDDEIRKLSESINARMEVVERSEYQSPNDWYFMNNYHYLTDAIELASKHVLNFEKIVKEKKKLRVCLTYQNFDIDHIVLNQEKIVSLEKISFNYPAIDIYSLFKYYTKSTINLTNYLENYFSINPLLEEEKEYLMALLYIFDYHRYTSQKDDIDMLVRIIDYLKYVNELEDLIFSSTEEE